MMSNLTLQFDLTARREKNLRVLQSVDDSVIEIIEDYSHVALYEFDATSKSWERLDVEGSMFVTRSLKEPLYSLIVLNKKGPNDFALDISTILKISLQKPYMMLRCSTPDSPIVFGIWSHSESELEAMYTMLVRIAVNKESPAAPASPQAKASQLLSMLKPKAAPAPAPAAASAAPQLSPTATTMVVSAAAAVATNTAGTSGSGKSAALLSALKGGSKSSAAPDATSSGAVAASTQPPEKGSGVEQKIVSAGDSRVSNAASSSGSNSTGSTKSAQLLSMLKSPTATSSGSAKETPKSAAATTTAASAAASISKTPAGTPAPAASAQAAPALTNSAAAPSRPSIDEARRAELMMKLVKPKAAATVDDLLTDVDIAAKVKAAAVSANTKENSSQQVNGGVLPSSAADRMSAGSPFNSASKANTEDREASSVLANTSAKTKEEILLRLVQQSTMGTSAVPGKTDVMPAARSSPSPTPTLPLPTRTSPQASGLPPRPSDRTLAGSPPGNASGLALATALFGQTGSTTQRSTEQLSAALRTANSTARVHQRSPSASPVLMGLSGPQGASLSQATPVSWASLSNSNLAAAGALGTSNPAAMTHSVSLDNLAAGPAPMRQAMPVLISPSDLLSKRTTGSG